MSQLPVFVPGAKKDCEASEVELLLLQGKRLEPRAYRISRPVCLSVPTVLPPKTATASLVRLAIGETE